MEEHLQTIYFNKESISKTYKNSDNSASKKNLIKKWIEDLNRHFSKDNIHEKMLKITNYQGHANQNHSFDQEAYKSTT